MTERNQQRLDQASLEAQRLLDLRVPRKLAARLYNQVVAALLQGADGFNIPAALAVIDDATLPHDVRMSVGRV